MGHHSYEDSVKLVYKGFWILLIVTLAEVAVSLIWKLWLHPMFKNDHSWLSYGILAIPALLIIILSIYKAKYIIFEFMHMAYEHRGLAWSVLLPMSLLIWGAIAFFQEGDSWKDRRELIKDKDEQSIEEVKKTGMLDERREKETKHIF